MEHNELEQDKDTAERKVQDVVLGIMQLAMMNHEVIHIHVRYSSHINNFNLCVYPISASYVATIREELFDIDISMNRNRFEDGATPLQQLLELEDKLLELIAEAKDNAGVAA
ncbi:hypothetical protein [Photobacterium sanguinicancri]|uniref:hypothetical protein n=1 Tax=Photobacterium sanguinicancri TaxID=875932 RepID=UPI002480FEA0|nr:hypothetical protein [Photobacterium sanguinicancri]